MMKALSGLAVIAVLATSVRAGENWPEWRGPARNGSSDSTRLPISWSETENVRWKTPLPSWSAATPAIWGDRVFVMSGSSAEEGRASQARRGSSGRLDPEGGELLVLCLARKDGSVLWERKVDDGNAHYNKQNMTSPSPVTNGDYVWTLTGTGIVTALDASGKIVWRRDIQTEYGKFHMDFGYASSPLLVEGKIIVQVLHGADGKNMSYLLALNAENGETAWKVDRPTDALEESCDAYTTPALLRYPDRAELVIGGGDYLTGHVPATGKEVWRCGGLNPAKDNRYRAVCSPVVADGMVFISARKGPLVACKAGGKGDVTATHQAWTSEAAPDVPTPASDGRFLYILHDNGMLTCLDAKTGEARYLKERLPGGPYSASPIVADGKVYVINEKARTTVLAAGPDFKVLGDNQLDVGYTLASIAVAGRELFVRSSRYLYCIGEESK